MRYKILIQDKYNGLYDQLNAETIDYKDYLKFEKMLLSKDKLLIKIAFENQEYTKEDFREYLKKEERNRKKKNDYKNNFKA